MEKQKFGRIIMTSSAAGLYGNFGQANVLSSPVYIRTCPKLLSVLSSSLLLVTKQALSVRCSLPVTIGRAISDYSRHPWALQSVKTDASNPSLLLGWPRLRSILQPRWLSWAYPRLSVDTHPDVARTT